MTVNDKICNSCNKQLEENESYTDEDGKTICKKCFFNKIEKKEELESKIEKQEELPSLFDENNEEILKFFNEQGLNIIPINPNTKDKPAVTWGIYQEEKFSFQALLEFYKNNNYAVICGSISGNLIVIDFDIKEEKKNLLTNEEVDEIYKQIINSIPDFLIKTLVIKSSSGGLHFYFILETMDSYLNLEQNKGLNSSLFLKNLDIEHVDIQGEVKYAIIPPSSIDGKYYEIYNKDTIQKIDDELFKKVLSIWTDPTSQNKEKGKEIAKEIIRLRKPLRSIALGEIMIEEYAEEHGRGGGEEFSYWDAFIRECIANNFEDEKIHKFLESQTNYDYRETEGHIRWVRRKATKPFTNEKLYELFPEDEFKIKKKEKESLFVEEEEQYYLTEENLKTLYNEIEKLDPKALTLRNDIRNILVQIPSKDSVSYKLIAEHITEKTPIGKRELSKEFKKILDERAEQKNIEKFKNLKQKGYDIVYYDDYRIEGREDGVYKIEYSIDPETKEEYEEPKKILKRGLKLSGKVRDYNIKEYRYNFQYNKGNYRTHTLSEMISVFATRLYKGNVGRDIITEFIEEMGDRTKKFKTSYVLGFRNGWKLPQTEEKLRVLIICQHDDDRKAFEKAKKILKVYTEEEKQQIIKKMRRFIDITEMDKTKLSIIIGIAFSCVFRGEFIRYYGLYPGLFLYGPQKAGKSWEEDFWFVHFYKIHDNHYSPSTLTSESQTSGLLSTGTFPVNVQEVHDLKNNDIIAMLKDYYTSTTNMRKKISATRYNIDKEKNAPLIMDANFLPNFLNDIPSGSKMINLKFEKIIEGNDEWVQLYRELKEEKLFSFLYEYTKNWNSKIVRTHFKELEILYNEKYKEYPRLKEVFVAVMFGLGLFSQCFKYYFTIGKEEIAKKILEELSGERRETTKTFEDEFREFCIIAMNFDPESNRIKFLTCGLKKIDGGYLFTAQNKRDFREFMNNDERTHSLDKIASNVSNSLEDKTLIEKTREGSNRKHGIVIKDKFFLRSD